MTMVQIQKRICKFITIRKKQQSNPYFSRPTDEYRREVAAVIYVCEIILSFGSRFFVFMNRKRIFWVLKDHVK
jgi:hypothetical protein